MKVLLKYLYVLNAALKSHPLLAFFVFVLFLLWGWSGGAMVLGNLPVPGRPTIWITVGQGPIALAVGASGVIISILSHLFLPLFGRRPDIV